MVGSTIRFISEAESSALITEQIAFDAVREALIAASRPDADSFPTVLGHGSDDTNRFTIKSAATRELAGAKIGSYWPPNDAKGLPRHNSLILLFDQEVGRIGAVIEGGAVNAYRTAAADAVAVDALARTDATTLAIFGTGHQALYECRAVTRVRPVDTVLVVGRSEERTRQFMAALAERGIRATGASAQEACERADIIVTATTAREPLFDASWVKPGSHVSSMGSDATGKQELPPDLLASSRLFCDLPSQSAVIGEFQHLSLTPEAAADRITAIGDVLTGVHPGRRGDEVTVFDSSGIALQDLYVGTALLAAQAAASAGASE